MDSKLTTSIVETLLARFLVIEIIHYQLVSKNWRAIIRSQTFQGAFREIQDRPPWFLMCNEDNTITSVYDVESGKWIQRELSIPKGTFLISISGYFMCSVSRQGTISVGNPFTGPLDPLKGCVIDNSRVAISVVAGKGKLYEVFVVLRKADGLAVKIYSSEAKAWREIELFVHELVIDSMDIDVEYYDGPSYIANSGMTTVNSEGDVLVYFLVGDYKLVQCDINHGIAYEYPFIRTPTYQACAYSLVESDGRIFVVFLKEDWDDAEFEHWDDDDIELEVLDDGPETCIYNMILQLHEFIFDEEQWEILTEKPVVLTGGDSNVISAVHSSAKGNCLMICFHSEDYVLLDQVVKYNILEDTWEKLPRCIDRVTGEARKFVSSFPIAQDIAFLV